MEAQIGMPRYKCHKEVWALQIKAVENRGGGKYYLLPAEAGYVPFKVSPEWVSRHSPEPGGYFVVYKDGYKSYSPAEAFEEGYSPVGLTDQEW